MAYSASDVEGDNAPETPNIFYTGQMIQRAIALCDKVTTDGKGALACTHSPECGLPKILNACRSVVGDERLGLLELATPALIAATIGTTNDFPPTSTIDSLRVNTVSTTAPVEFVAKSEDPEN